MFNKKAVRQNNRKLKRIFILNMFQLGFVETDSREQFFSSIAKMGFYTIRLDITSMDFQAFYEQLKQNQYRIFLITGLENKLNDITFLQNLNMARDRIASLRIRLIFILPKNTLQSLSHTIRDFYSFRNIVLSYEFNPPPKTVEQIQPNNATNQPSQKVQTQENTSSQQISQQTINQQITDKQLHQEIKQDKEQTTPEANNIKQPFEQQNIQHKTANLTDQNTIKPPTVNINSSADNPLKGYSSSNSLTLEQSVNELVTKLKSRSITEDFYFNAVRALITANKKNTARRMLEAVKNDLTDDGKRMLEIQMRSL